MDKTNRRTAKLTKPRRARPRKEGNGVRTALNPRTRMLEAMLANIGEQGYAATVVADVIAKAVASRKTFYEHFEDKQACFFAMSDEIVEKWVEQVAATDDSGLGWREGIDAYVDTLFALTLKSPSALRVIAVELTAAGPTGIERRERALARLAQPLRETLGDSSEDGELVARVIVGAILRILYARARRGERVCRPRRGELLELAPKVAAWAATYKSDSGSGLSLAKVEYQSDGPAVGGRAPGTLSLNSRAIERRGLPRGEGNVSRSFVVHNQRERILDALANLAAAKGYSTCTIPDIVQEAAVSVQAFYEHFSGKEDAFLVAYELGHRKVLAIVERAYESQEDWPSAIHAGIEALFAFLASEPAYAHLALIDALTASAKSAAVAHDGMRSYMGMLEPKLELNLNGDQPASVTVEATAGALLELCFVYVASERARELSDLVTFAEEIALRPFVGTNVR